MKGLIIIAAALLAATNADDYCSNDAIAGCKGQSGE